MSRKPYPLTSYISHVLDLFSDKYPGKIVSPQLISCYVVDQSGGRTYFYPIKGLETINRSVDRNPSRDEVGVHIDTYSFCQSPIGITTRYTTYDMLRYIRNTSTYCGDSNLYCPQLGKKLYYVSRFDKEDEILEEFLKEGILLFKVI